MIALIAVGGMALVAMPGLVRRWGRQLPPLDWSRLIAGSLVAGGLLAELALVILSLPALLDVVHGSALAKACSRVLGPLVPPGGPYVAWTAALLMASSAVTGVRTWRRTVDVQRVGRMEAWVGDHLPRPGWELVVLPCDDLLALSAPGQPPQVILSTGLVRRLSGGHLDAVVAHEQGHLDHGHHRHLRLAALVERALWFVPGARRSGSALRVAIERCADEHAATRVDRRHIREALAAVGCAPIGPHFAAFGAASTIVERLQALDEPPPRRSFCRALPLYLSSLALGLGSVGALASQGDRLGLLASLLGRCMY